MRARRDVTPFPDMDHPRTYADEVFTGVHSSVSSGLAAVVEDLLRVHLPARLSASGALQRLQVWQDQQAAAAAEAQRNAAAREQAAAARRARETAAAAAAAAAAAEAEANEIRRAQEERQAAERRQRKAERQRAKKQARRTSSQAQTPEESRQQARLESATTTSAAASSLSQHHRGSRHRRNRAAEQEPARSGDRDWSPPELTVAGRADAVTAIPPPQTLWELDVQGGDSAGVPCAVTLLQRLRVWPWATILFEVRSCYV
jgi:hypothetical protein